MKRFLNVLSVILAVLSFQACDSRDNAGKGAVAAILKSGGSDYTRQMVESIESECRKRGLEPLILTTDNEYDVQSQVKAAAYLSECGYDVKGIIFMPVYSEGETNGAESAIRSFAVSHDIPVVFVDTKPASGSPLEDIFKAYVGVDIQKEGEAFATTVVTEQDPSRILSILYGTAATMERYRIFKEEKGIRDDSNAIIVTDGNGLAVSSLNAKLAGLPEGGSVVLFNGDFYDQILALGSAVSGMDGKSVYAFDVYKSLLQSIKTGGSVKTVQAQNTFEMGRRAVECLFSESSREELIPTIRIDSGTLSSSEVKPFIDFFGL